MRPTAKDWYRGTWSLDIMNQSWTEDTERQVDFIIEKLELKGGERILDLACGYGRHALSFARRGFHTVGLDITSGYVNYANECAHKESLSARFICADIREAAFQNEFDVVLNMADGAIGYLEDDAENEKIFDVVARALKHGGKHFMDIMNADYADTHFPCSLWEAGEKGLTLSRFEWDPTTRTLLYGQRDYHYGSTLEKPEFKEGSPIRLYTLDEVKGIMQERGMHVTASYANCSGEEASARAIQMMVCSHKQN